MIKIELGTTDYEVGGLTIDQWSEINKWDEEKRQWGNVDLISLMLNVELDEVKKATIKQINFVGNFLQKYVVEKSQKSELKMLIKTEDEVLGLIKPQELTYGEYVDLETLIAMKPLNMKHISAILYRPTTEHDEVTGESKLVPYDYNECLQRSEDMGNFYVGDTLASLFFLIIYNQKLVEGFHESMVKNQKEMTE